ncbi:MAG: stage III sporulation protein AB [Defluviitaleaceae bacterium]|nr:stage III sporulation protein AB [Defluviitaleaceae bacterium]
MLIFLNITGIVLIMVSTGLIGLYYSNVDGYRISDLLEFKRAISILQSEIEYTGTPLSEAASNVALRTNGSVSRIFERLSELVVTNRQDSMADIWKTAFLPAVDEAYFSKKDVEQFLEFGNALGYLDSNMQLKNITLLLDYIENRIDELNATKIKNRKMYSSAGVLTGLLIVVILI